MSGPDGTEHIRCELQRGCRLQIAWVPLKYAVLGLTIKLRCPEGLWINGWRVTEICEPEACDPVQLSAAS